MVTGVSGPAEAEQEKQPEQPEQAGGGLGQRSRPTWYDRRGWRAVAMAAGIVLLFYCAQRMARQLAPTSDGAAMVLESWAMLHGNLVLHGWQLADVSFYTTELPEYMLVELVRGFNPDVVRFCAALTYTLLVVLAAAVAYGARPADKRTAAVRAGITVTVMIGPTLLAATTLLNDPDHTGTAVPILLALLVLDRARRRWWVPVLVAAVLGWALVGDSLVLLIGVAPLVIVCGARAFGSLALRREPLAAAWYDVALTAAGLAAVVVGKVLTHLIQADGGYVMTPSATQATVSSTDLPANVAATVTNFLGLFSADFFDERLNDWLAVTAVHVVFACLVAVGLFVALRGYRRDFLHGDLIAQLLAAGVVINLLGYLFLYPGGVSTGREIAPVFGLGGALAGRVLAEPLLRRRLEPLLALGAVAAVAVLLPTMLTVRPPSPASANLARFLVAHDLTRGVAGYWNADSVTLDSRGKVVMVPAKFHRGLGLSALPWEIDTQLYDSSANNANFLVATAPDGNSSVTQAEAIARFGPPYRQYSYEGNTIMVWHKNLLSQLPSAPPTG